MRRNRLLPCWCGVLAVILGGVLAPRVAIGQGLEYVKSHYTKYEYRIPMRDGKRLFTSVYAPKDQSLQWPILLTRTPYSVGPYGEDRYKADLGPSPLFGKEGYIFVYQDVRGCYMSEGEFMDMRPHVASPANPALTDESTDTWDSIEWLTKKLPIRTARWGCGAFPIPASTRPPG